MSLLSFAVVACAHRGPSPAAPAGDKAAYLFSYFRGNGDDGVHLAWSADGITWSALNGGKPVVTPAITGDGIGWQDWNSRGDTYFLVMKDETFFPVQTRNAPRLGFSRTRVGAERIAGARLHIEVDGPHPAHSA